MNLCSDLSRKVYPYGCCTTHSSTQTLLNNNNMVTDKTLNFSQALPQLAALYRQGLLVPFLGSGMSINVCGTWDQLLTKLAILTKIRVESFMMSPNTNDIAKMQLADEAVDAIKSYPLEEQITIYRKALIPEGQIRVIPNKTKALANLFWPLVIQTNYDDVYWKAVDDRERNQLKRINLEREAKKRTPVSDAKLAFSIPTVLGRSLEDCHTVLRSLDEVHPPYIWSIQGFIGGQLAEAEEVVKNDEKRKQLASQLVVGHQQYQRTINADSHFRRAFADVFRRRSLLFLGSGILESYLINLFSEILHHQGSGPYPHFALINEEKKSSYDSLFMQRRLGIVPIYYNNEDKGHQEITKYLEEFSAIIRFWFEKDKIKQEIQTLPASPIVFQDKIGFRLSARSEWGKLAQVEVNFIKSTLPTPKLDATECSIVSVGRDKNNNPHIGGMAHSHIESAAKKKLVNVVNHKLWKALDGTPSYVYRYGDSSIFALAARSRDLSGLNHDVRDLGIIAEAVCKALQAVDEVGYSIVKLGTIASGSLAPWHTIYPFAETLRGIRQFLSSPVRNVSQIDYYVINPETWYPIISDKIPILGLLTSSVSTHTVEIRTNDLSVTPERFSITSQSSLLVRDLLAECKIDAKRWNIDVEPYPVSAHEGQKVDVLNMTISAAMRVVLTPIGK